MIDDTKRFTAYRYLALTAAAVALAGAFAATPARAADATTSVAVRYGDLDLASSQGEAALKDRVARAARQACGLPDTDTIDGYARVAQCRANAIADASPKLDRVIASARSDHRYAMNDGIIAVRGD
jgi:UrcA family protein